MEGRFLKKFLIINLFCFLFAVLPFKPLLKVKLQMVPEKFRYFLHHQVQHIMAKDTFSPPGAKLPGGALLQKFLQPATPGAEAKR